MRGTANQAGNELRLARLESREHLREKVPRGVLNELGALPYDTALSVNPFALGASASSGPSRPGRFQNRLSTRRRGDDDEFCRIARIFWPTAGIIRQHKTQ